MTISDSFADSWTLDDYMRMLRFQIEAYQLCKERDHSSLMAFNLAAIEIECDRILTIVREMKREGGIIDG
jgi:hypothetical protein